MDEEELVVDGCGIWVGANSSSGATIDEDDVGNSMATSLWMKNQVHWVEEGGGRGEGFSLGFWVLIGFGS